jgi:hypothetical protein
MSAIDRTMRDAITLMSAPYLGGLLERLSIASFWQIHQQAQDRRLFADCALNKKSSIQGKACAQATMLMSLSGT